MHVCVCMHMGAEGVLLRAAPSVRWKAVFSHMCSVVVQNHLHCRDLISLMFALVICQKLLASPAVLQVPGDQENSLISWTCTKPPVK